MVKRALAPNADDRYAGRQARCVERSSITRASAKLVANPLRLGAWLSDHFGAELVAQRSAREAAARALDPSPTPARAVPNPTPEAPRISLKPDEEPASLSPIDISPPSKQPAKEEARKTPWVLIGVGAVVAGVVAWLLSR